MAAPTIRSLVGTLVSVPMRRPLHTSALRITQAPLLLIDLTTSEGVVGRAYLFCYVASAGRAALELLRDMEDVLRGEPGAPAIVRRRLENRFRLLGIRGLVPMVMAGIDIACWDAMAIAAGLPLATMLGGDLRPTRAYNSNGLGLIEPAAAAAEAVELVEEGFEAIKVRLGRPRIEDDIAAVRAIRKAVPDSVALMTDFNQALTTSEALMRCRALDDEGVYWIEEPIAHDDYVSYAEIVRATKTPIQIGENFAGPRAMALALSHRASGLVMPDLERIGGVTGWIAAAALADAARVQMSSHLFHEVSAHLLSVTPTADWIEYVDWADAILQEPLRVSNGSIAPPDRPGNGMIWDDEAVRRYTLASSA